jgi:hypothetical protein
MTRKEEASDPSTAKSGHKKEVKNKVKPMKATNQKAVMNNYAKPPPMPTPRVTQRKVDNFTALETVFLEYNGPYFHKDQLRGRPLHYVNGILH